MSGIGQGWDGLADHWRDKSPEETPMTVAMIEVLSQISDRLGELNIYLSMLVKKEK